MNSLRDKGIQAGLVLLAAAAAGFAGIGMAWSGVAATLLPEVQVPFVVSGAIGGVAVAGTALAVLATQMERRVSATERVSLDAMIGSATVISEELLPVAAGYAAAVPRRAGLVTVRNGRTAHRPGCRAVRNKQLERVSSPDRVEGLRACGICRPEI